MEKHIELRTVDGDMMRLRHDKDSVSDAKGQEFDRDRYELARVGKEQVLKVRTHQRQDIPDADIHSVALVSCL